MRLHLAEGRRSAEPVQRAEVRVQAPRLLGSAELPPSAARRRLVRGRAAVLAVPAAAQSAVVPPQPAAPSGMLSGQAQQVQGEGAARPLRRAVPQHVLEVRRSAMQAQASAVQAVHSVEVQRHLVPAAH